MKSGRNTSANKLLFALFFLHIRALGITAESKLALITRVQLIGV